MHLPPLIPPASITPYLSCSGVINCTNAEIRSSARSVTSADTDDVERARTLYYWVRDTITHSADSGQAQICWNASDVLSSGHGLCFGKAHLFVALCRALGIPAGLCYQRVQRDDETWVLHGLAAVFLEQLDRWVRLDPRGNKQGINADFSIFDDSIAYEPVHEGEWLDQHIYPEPWHELSHMVTISSNISEFIEKTSQIRSPPVHQVRVEPIGSTSCSS